MKQPSNVIDLKSRRHISEEIENKNTNNAPVLDMTERRNEMLTQERRIVRRTILTEFIGAHVIVPEKGLQRVTIYDISDTGIAFDVDLEYGAFREGEEIVMRVYLNHQTYFPFVVRVSNVREIQTEGVTRHGGRFASGTVNDVALHHFVKFIETVSASLRTDQGDVMVSGLRG